jgi:anti-sigma28 factor (negative regulator of flagellin synthesis)
MKISRPDSKSTSGLDRSAGLASAPEGLASQQPNEQTAAAASDQAQISNLSSYLASALNGSALHLAKLSELGAAISSGHYHVDTYVVSGSIIQHALEFGTGSYFGLTT